jgi:hypothetical protein
VLFRSDTIMMKPSGDAKFGWLQQHQRGDHSQVSGHCC